MFEFSGPGKSHWYYSELGDPETAYFGNKASSNAPLYVYNKRAQLKQKGRSAQYGSAPFARLERRLKPNSPAAGLVKAKSKLSTIKVFSPGGYSPDIAGQPDLWPLFLDSCRIRGEKAALQLLPPLFPKAKYAEAFQSARDGFWLPDKIWAAWPACLAKCGLPIWAPD